MHANAAQLVLLGCFAGAVAPAGAAEPAALVVQADVRSLDRAEAEQERLRKMLEGKPKAYEDKVLDASPLPAAADLDAPAVAEEGLRTFVSETRAGFAQSDTSGLKLQRSAELGQHVEYRRETLNYGAFSLLADVRASHGDAGLSVGSLGASGRATGERIVLRNTAFPITGRLFADTSVGDVPSEVTDALGRAYRVSLGSSIVRGASTHVYDGETDVRAGFGERGNLAGGPYPGFERSRGTLAWAGASRRFGHDAFAGVQATRATGVPSFTLTAPGVVADSEIGSIAASAGYGGALLADGDHRGRIIYVRSTNSRGAAAASQGVFLEGAARTGTARHEFGAYQADPDLRYGDYLLASDNRGAYWRVDGTSLRLNWGLGVDVDEQNPHGDPDRLHRRGVTLNANAQFRIDRDRMVGGTAALAASRYESSAFASLGDGTRGYFASAFYQTRFARFGPSRVRVTARRNEVLVANDIPATGEEIEWEQDWIGGRYETLRPEFTTTIGLARDRSNGVAETRPTAGAAFRLWPDADWSVGGNLRYTAGHGNLSTSRGLSGTLDTEKTLQDGWTVGASVSLNQARIAFAPGGLGTPVVSRSNDKFASVYLRWEGSSGGGFQGAGLRAGGSVGAGAATGIVYLDANRDGEQQVGEAGMPNVEVVLDGRYRATTDRNGRFAFPLVGTGRHQLTLTLETVPLPWGAASDQPVGIEVPLRGEATARIPVVRVGE